jgi:hypothetical protein
VRPAAIVLCALGSLLLLMGSLTGSWFDVAQPDEKKATEAEDIGDFFSSDNEREHPVNFGLRDATVCRDDPSLEGLFSGGNCRNVSYQDIGAADAESVAIMKIAYVIGLLGFLWLGACAILIGIAVRGERGFALAAVGAATGCFLAGIGVDVIRPRLLAELDVSVGSSFWLYVLGALAGVAGGVCGARLRPAPTAPEMSANLQALFPPELSTPPPPGAPRTAIPTPVPLPSPPVEPRACPRCGASARWVFGYRRHWCDACNNWL